jgi:lysophospholipase L1-like esterase
MPSGTVAKARTPIFKIAGSTQAVSVTVTNADGSSFTAPNAFTYRVPANVLAYGDSITYGISCWDVPIDETHLAGYECGPPAVSGITPYPDRLQESLRSQFGGGVTVVNGGLAGDTAANWSSRLPGLLPGKDLVVIQIGVNDINGPETVSAIVTHIGNIVQAAKDAGKDVLLGNILPAKPARADNAKIADVNAGLVTMAAAKRVQLVDLNTAFGPAGSPSFDRYISPDGLHPSGEGFQLISNLLFGRAVEMYPK